MIFESDTHTHTQKRVSDVFFYSHEGGPVVGRVQQDRRLGGLRGDAGPVRVGHRVSDAWKDKSQLTLICNTCRRLDGFVSVKGHMTSPGPINTRI